ncbi:MAG: DUF1833 family protein [Sterolibacterium sp.]
MVGVDPLASSPLGAFSEGGEAAYGFRREIVERDQREINRQESPEVHLVFLTISHPELSDPIYVVLDSSEAMSEPNRFIYAGIEYIAFPFEIELLSDTDSVPKARLSIQNVDKVIGETIANLTNPPRMRFEVVPASYFDLNVTPRVELETPVPMYVADELYLTNVDVDAMTVTGQIESWNYSQETWPGRRATQNRCPGLFR